MTHPADGSASRVDGAGGADGSPSDVPPASFPDAGHERDAESSDKGTPQPPAPDAAPPDASAPDAAPALDAMPLPPAATSPPFWLNAAAFSSPRSNLGAALGGDGVIYAMGGYYGPRLDTAVSYSPAADAWSSAPVMSMARERIAAVALGGSVYAIGGYGPNTAVAATALVEALAPGGSAWVRRASMLTPRQQLAAVVGADGRIYALGGANDTTGTYASVEAYDPNLDSWSPVAPMSLARNSFAAAAFEDRIYVFGGTNGSPLSAAEVYSLTTAAWTPIASLPAPRAGHGGVAGPDGRIYAVGGYDGTSNLTSVIAYDPTTNHWDPVASMAAQRSGGTAVRGPDGRIFVFGGDDTHAFSSLVEVYGPVVHLSSDTGTAGSMISVTGGNFGANATVHMYFGPIQGTPVAFGHTDGTGALSSPVQFLVPNLSAGTYLFTAVDDGSRYPITLRFKING